VLREYNNKQMDLGRRMNLRVVINTGDVSIENNDIYGEAVNVTARMEGLPCFPGGSIGVSESTYLLMNRNEIVAEKIGPQQLKGIPEPVTVFGVPLERQKLTTIPGRLLQLVERAVDSGAMKPGSQIGPQLNEWANAVNTFLKEKNWGENIDQIKGQVGRGVGQIQDKMVKTFGQKTVLEKGSQQDLQDAGIPKRLQSFAIDALILVLVTFAVSIVWYLLGTVFGLFVNYHLKSLLIKLLVFVLPIPLWFVYFAAFWKIKGATPGQIAIGTAVVDAKGGPIDWVQAAKRSGIFLASCVLFGLGALTIFTAEKQTIFDKIARTRVVE